MDTCNPRTIKNSGNGCVYTVISLKETTVYLKYSSFLQYQHSIKLESLWETFIKNHSDPFFKLSDQSTLILTPDGIHFLHNQFQFHFTQTTSPYFAPSKFPRPPTSVSIRAQGSCIRSSRFASAGIILLCPHNRTPLQGCSYAGRHWSGVAGTRVK